METTPYVTATPIAYVKRCHNLSFVSSTLTLFALSLLFWDTWLDSCCLPLNTPPPPLASTALLPASTLLTSAWLASPSRVTSAELEWCSMWTRSKACCSGRKNWTKLQKRQEGGDRFIALCANLTGRGQKWAKLIVELLNRLSSQCSHGSKQRWWWWQKCWRLTTQ